MAEASETTNVSTAGAGSLHRIPPLHGTENYNVWRIQIEDILTDLDLYGYVTGAKKLPEETIEVSIEVSSQGKGKPRITTTETQTNAKYTKWIRADRKALSIYGYEWRVVYLLTYRRVAHPLMPGTYSP